MLLLLHNTRGGQRRCCAGAVQFARDRGPNTPPRSVSPRARGHPHLQAAAGSIALAAAIRFSFDGSRPKQPRGCCRCGGRVGRADAMRRRMSFAAVHHLALAASARAGAANACTSAVCAQGQALEYDCCVVGAGPGGLQLGELLRTAGRSYAIFEQGTGPGSFFETFPRHRRLVSLNKRFTGSARACAMHAVGCTSYILAAGVHASRRAVLRGHAPARHVRGSARARVAGAGSPRLSPRHTPSISCKLKSTHQTCSPASMHDGPGCLCVSMQLKLTPPLTGNACLACMRMPPRPRDRKGRCLETRPSSDLRLDRCSS